MASQTLAQTSLMTQNDLIRLVVEDIVDVNPFYQFLPFNDFKGNAIAVNREDTLGDAGMYAVDAAITHNTPQTIVQRTFTATKLIGDAEVDGLVQIQAEGDGEDVMASEIRSKAKRIGQLYQEGMATGAGTGTAMNSFHSLVDSSQYTTSSAGQALSFALLDELLDLIKEGADFIMMPARTIRAYKNLLRAYGGNTQSASMDVVFADGKTRSIIAYEDIPIFKNEFLSIVETADGAALTGGALTSVWAGKFDDGTKTRGVAGINPRGSTGYNGGVMVDFLGKKEGKDSEQVRVKQYANFVNFNRRGLARLPSINN